MSVCNREVEDTAQRGKEDGTTSRIVWQCSLKVTVVLLTSYFWYTKCMRHDRVYLSHIWWILRLVAKSSLGHSVLPTQSLTIKAEAVSMACLWMAEEAWVHIYCGWCAPSLNKTNHRKFSKFASVNHHLYPEYTNILLENHWWASFYVPRQANS